jgi:hypothetical protein
MPTIPRLTFHNDAQPASHMMAANNTGSPSTIRIISYCSSARVRRRRLSLSASLLIVGQRYAHHADRAMPVNRPACVAIVLSRHDALSRHAVCLIIVARECDRRVLQSSAGTLTEGPACHSACRFRSNLRVVAALNIQARTQTRRQCLIFNYLQLQSEGRKQQVERHLADGAKILLLTRHR